MPKIILRVVSKACQRMKCLITVIALIILVYSWGFSSQSMMNCICLYKNIRNITKQPLQHTSAMNITVCLEAKAKLFYYLLFRVNNCPSILDCSVTSFANSRKEGGRVNTSHTIQYICRSIRHVSVTVLFFVFLILTQQSTHIFHVDKQFRKVHERRCQTTKL